LFATEGIIVVDRAQIAARLTSPDGFLALCDESGVMGAKKKAKAAFDLWNQADQPYVGAYRGIPGPRGWLEPLTAERSRKPSASSSP
jgi:hypothetical protein